MFGSSMFSWLGLFRRARSRQRIAQIETELASSLIRIGGSISGNTRYLRIVQGFLLNGIHGVRTF